MTVCAPLNIGCSVQTNSSAFITFMASCAIEAGTAKLIPSQTMAATASKRIFIIPLGVRIVVAYQLAAGFLRVASNVPVADGRKSAPDQRSLSDMQITRLVLSKVNDKNALCCTIPPRGSGDRSLLETAVGSEAV